MTDDLHCLLRVFCFIPSLPKCDVYKYFQLPKSYIGVLMVSMVKAPFRRSDLKHPSIFVNLKNTKKLPQVIPMLVELMH